MQEPGQVNYNLTQKNHRDIRRQRRWDLRIDWGSKMAGRLLPSHEQTVPTNSNWHRIIRADRGQEQERKGEPIRVGRVYCKVFLQPKQKLILLICFFMMIGFKHDSKSIKVANLLRNWKRKLKIKYTVAMWWFVVWPWLWKWSLFWKACAWFLFSQRHIVLHHSVDFHAHLLVDLAFDEFSVDKKRDQESQSHKQENEENCEPEVVCFVKGFRARLVLDETVTLFRLGQKRIANHFKNLGRLEQTVKVFTVYHSLRVEDYVLLVSFLCHPVEHILRVEFCVAELFDCVCDILLDGLDQVVWDAALLHCFVGA